MSGYYGIGIFHGKTGVNLGTLWRSAYQLGAAFAFTVGRRYRPQASDTTKAWRSIPLFDWMDFEMFLAHGVPYDCPIVAVEMGGTDLRRITHPARCIYLLGAEDYGLPPDILRRCHSTVSIPSERMDSYNVAVAGSIIMYDRFAKGGD